jgi:hypothetical protein
MTSAPQATAMSDVSSMLAPLQGYAGNIQQLQALLQGVGAGTQQVDPPNLQMLLNNCSCWSFKASTQYRVYCHHCRHIMARHMIQHQATP